MREEELLSILADWNFWGKGIETGMPRYSYVKRILSLLDDAPIVAEVGVRRSGKSYIARQVIKELIDTGMNKKETLVIDLNDERLQKDGALLNDVYAAYKKNINPSANSIIAIDEPQELVGWEKFVRGISERREAKFIVTGSSSSLLSSEFSTLLGGREVELPVFPLGFMEFLNFKGIAAENKLEVAKNIRSLLSALDEYAYHSSFPAVILARNKQELLNSYFDTILVKDIALRYKIRSEGKLRALAKFYLTNIAHPITYNSVARFTGLPVKTVERFSDFIASSFLLFFVKRFSFSVKEQENSPRKVYAIDNGLALAAGFDAAVGKGALVENLVAVELKRRGHEFYYWKETQTGKEADFVVKAKVGYELIQVCSAITDLTTFERERGALRSAIKVFGKKRALLIVYSMPKDRIVSDLAENGIAIKQLWEWLLENKQGVRGNQHTWV